jgi:glycosyltransferase involved in cell wall biosynthesis
VVHVHSALSSPVTAVRAGLLILAARGRGCRTVLHAHGGLVLHHLESRLLSVVLRTFLPVADVVVSVSGAVKQGLDSMTGAEVRLIDNAVDVGVFAAGTDAHDPPRILYVGVLTPRKGLLDLFEASRLLARRGLDHRLLVVGGAPDEGVEAERQVLAQAPDTVELLGSMEPERMPAVYREADVFCLPSWWEAMPLSVLEAMASGVPVVATDVGDVSRVVQTDVTGSLVPSKDPEKLATVLERLLVDVDLRRRLGAGARALVSERFSTGALADRLADIYDTVGDGAKTGKR